MSQDPNVYVQSNISDVENAVEAIFHGQFPHMHKIIDGLYLGDKHAAGVLFPYEKREKPEMLEEAYRSLLEHGITHIVCVCGEGEDWRPFAARGMRYIDVLLNDGDDAAILETTEKFGETLQRAVPFIQEAIRGGGAALVHCASGAHRSASIVCGYLMQTQGKSLDDVFPEVFTIRPVARPCYWQYLVNYVEKKRV